MWIWYIWHCKIFRFFFSFYFRVEESTDLGNAIQCLEAYDFKAEDNNEFLTLVFISFILYNLIRFDTETAVSVVPSRCTMHIYYHCIIRYIWQKGRFLGTPLCDVHTVYVWNWYVYVSVRYACIHLEKIEPSNGKAKQNENVTSVIFRFQDVISRKILNCVTQPTFFRKKNP